MDSGPRRLRVGEVRSTLAALFGEKCWRVGTSYGDELKLDIGRKRPGRYYRERLFGEWRLGCRASPWRFERIDSGEVIATSRQPLYAAMSRLKEIEGSRVVDVRISGRSLRLEVLLSSGVRMIVTPRAVGGDLAHWEVFGPRFVLAAGPGRRFTATRHVEPPRRTVRG